MAAVTLLGMHPATSPPAAAGELTPFEDCGKLRQWYVDAALPRVTPWGMDTPQYYGGPVMAMEDARATVPVSAGGPEGAVQNGATGTNVQEQGVDEPDLAKTNGLIAVVLRNDELVVYDVTGDEPVEVGRLDLTMRQRATELLLVGDRALLLNPGFGHSPEPVILSDVRAPARIGQWSTPRTTMTTVDVADPAQPFVVDTRSVEGSMISAREHDGSVRVVVSSTPAFDFVHPTRTRSPVEARAENRRMVRESTAQDWLPATGRGSGRIDEPLLECTLVQHPAAASATSTITVLRIDPSQPADVDVTAVSADGNLVYSSLDRLYVATTDWGWGWQSLRDGERQPTTDIHAFSVDGTQTEYVASGTVAGTVPDRWAFSEYDGNLRVASTLGQVWSPRETVVTVFEEDADRLSVVGSVGGLGENEQIHAVRWFDEVAVIVTFRQVDPLYTVDLGDPTSPRVLGELKIPGFSEYLHPIGDDLLLGVGQDATNQGQLRGSQLSTFDLTELTDVTRLATLGLGTHAYSAVEEDSRAFTYLADQRLAFIPVSDWSGGSEVAVARVDDQGRLDLVTTIELSGWGGDARVLPIEDDRVAVVSHGEVVQLLHVTEL